MKKTKTFWVVDGLVYNTQKELLDDYVGDDKNNIYECQVVKKYRLEDSPKLIEIK